MVLVSLDLWKSYDDVETEPKGGNYLLQREFVFPNRGKS